MLLILSLTSMEAVIAQVDPYEGTFVPADKYETPLIRKIEILKDNGKTQKVKIHLFDVDKGDSLVETGSAEYYSSRSKSYGKIIVSLSKSFGTFIEIYPRYFPHKRAEGFPSIGYIYYHDKFGRKEFIEGALERKSESKAIVVKKSKLKKNESKKEH